jgi:hypothetical protein
MIILWLSKRTAAALLAHGRYMRWREGGEPVQMNRSFLGGYSIHRPGNTVFLCGVCAPYVGTEQFLALAHQCYQT